MHHSVRVQATAFCAFRNTLSTLMHEKDMSGTAVILPAFALGGALAGRIALSPVLTQMPTGDPVSVKNSTVPFGKSRNCRCHTIDL
jgi:hypothetical protein